MSKIFISLTPTLTERVLTPSFTVSVINLGTDSVRSLRRILMTRQDREEDGLTECAPLVKIFIKKLATLSVLFSLLLFNFFFWVRI